MWCPRGAAQSGANKRDFGEAFVMRPPYLILTFWTCSYLSLSWFHLWYHQVQVPYQFLIPSDIVGSTSKTHLHLLLPGPSHPSPGLFHQHPYWSSSFLCSCPQGGPFCTTAKAIFYIEKQIRSFPTLNQWLPLLDWNPNALLLSVGLADRPPLCSVSWHCPVHDIISVS